MIKFILDKFIVFEDSENSFRYTGKQFLIYFSFAILTTIENLGIQFLLNILTNWPLSLRIFIALTFGYTTKFILDQKYCFNVKETTKIGTNDSSS